MVLICISVMMSKWCWSLFHILFVTCTYLEKVLLKFFAHLKIRLVFFGLSCRCFYFPYHTFSACYPRRQQPSFFLLTRGIRVDHIFNDIKHLWEVQGAGLSFTWLILRAYLSCSCSLYILDINTLSFIWFCSTFSYCLCTLLVVSLMQKSFWF